MLYSLWTPISPFQLLLRYQKIYHQIKERQPGTFSLCLSITCILIFIAVTQPSSSCRIIQIKRNVSTQTLSHSGHRRTIAHSKIPVTYLPIPNASLRVPHGHDWSTDVMPTRQITQQPPSSHHEQPQFLPLH